MMCSIQELGYTRYDFPDAPEHGIYILAGSLLAEKYGPDFSDNEILGKDICEVLGFDDHVVEFEITPNRPDCLCIVGIAREASATLGVGI